MLEPFIALLEEVEIALLGVTHLGKSVDLKTPAHKILGSVAYSNLARTVHITVRDPEDRDRRLLCQVKNNLAPEQPALAYRIIEHTISHNDQSIQTSRVEFEPGTVDADAAELMAAGRAPRKRGPEPKKVLALAEWLYDYMKDRPSPTPLGAIFDAAGEAGHAGQRKTEGKWSNPNLLYRASEKVAKLPPPRAGKRVESFKVRGEHNGRDITYWQLIDAAAEF